MSRILLRLLLCTLIIPGSALGQTLSTTRIALGHPANGDVERIGNYLAVSGFSVHNRWLSLVGLGDYEHISVDIPPEAQFFGRITLADQEREQLVFLTQSGLSVFSPERHRHQVLAEVSSLYPVADQQRLRFKDFAQDVNGSGLSDFLIPDFHVYHLLVQQNDGTFETYHLKIGAQAHTQQHTVQYTPRRPYLMDINLNGKTDVVFVRDGQLWAFLQEEGGGFIEQPKIIDPGVKLSSDDEANLRTGDGRNFEGLLIYRAHDFLDVDGDGLMDLVVREELYESAIEQNYTYRIHYGRETASGLEFPSEPDTRIATSGIQFEPVFEDVTGNGRKDFYTPSAQFGVRTIVRALLRGSARLDIEFYVMDEARNFPSEPNYRHRVTADVSIGAGRVDLPLVKTASFDDSGMKSLLVSEKRNELSVYAPRQGSLFEREPTRFSIPLPRDGARARVLDLDHGVAEELVLPFDAQDDAEHRNQLLLLRLAEENSARSEP